MAARLITIEISGDEKGYTAAVNRIQEANKRLNRDAIEGAQRVNITLQSMQRSLSSIAGMFGVGFGVGAFVALGKSALDAAGQIDDLSKRTGFARSTLSAYKSTIEESGGTLQGFATAINRAQRSLGDITGEGKQAAAALKAMGLDVNALVRMAPEQFFETLAKALSQVENQNQRVAIAQRVMGRAGAEQIPVILELTEKFEELRGKGVSDETIRKLDEIGDAFTRLKNKAITLAQEGLVAVVNMFDRLFNISDAAKFDEQLQKINHDLDELNKRIETTKKAPSISFGLFSGRDAQEQRRQQELARLESQRTQGLITQAFWEEKIAALMKADQPKPTAPAPLLNLDTSKADELAKQREAQAKALTQAQGQLLQLQLATAEAGKAQGSLTADVRAAALALIEHERASTLAAAAHDKTLTPALKASIEQIAQLKVQQLDLKAAEVSRREGLEQLRREIEAETRAEEELGQIIKASEADKVLMLQQLNDEFAQKSELAALDVEMLRIQGRETEARQLALQTIIRLNEERRKEAQLRGIALPTADTEVRQKQIENAQTQLQRLGTVTVDIGRHIGDSLNDIFTAMIQGTLKGVDILKTAGATVGRIVTDIFQQTIKNKLSFELDLFNNLRGLPAQANSAVASGTSSQRGGILQTLLGGNGGVGGNVGGVNLAGGGFNLGGIGDILNTLLTATGGRGGAPAGVAGPLMESGAFFSGSGGGLSSIISSVGSGVSKLLPAGSSIGGALGGAFGGFGIGSMINGKTGGIAGAIGGAAGSLIGSSTAIGSALGIAGGSLTGGLTSMLATLVGPMIASMLSSMIIPGIGAIIAALMSLLSRPPDPALWVKSSITFFYDEINQAFNQFTQTSLIKIQGNVKKSKIKQVLGQQQEILDTESQRWVDVLNTFPVYVHEQMVETLESANELLGVFFGRKKYSEGGKRNIQKELDDLKNMEAPRGVFAALRETIGVGLGGVLDVAGLTNAGTAAREAFPRWMIGQSENLPGVMLPSGSAEETEKFIEALKKMIGFTSALAKFAPVTAGANMGNSGLAKFLTPEAIETIETELAGVFSTTGKDFAKAVDSFLERMKPIQEFLAESMKQASELLGRGMIAALDAATQSDAKAIFLNSLSSGVKDMIFQGITSAFIASARFTDLLAPIQKTIKQFIEEALATGTPPDLGEFRRAIFPAIESISTRAELLAPLIGELQQLGFAIKDTLKLNPAPTEATSNINVTINGNVNDTSDAYALADRLGAILSGQLMPGQ